MPGISREEVVDLLLAKHDQYNNRGFIDHDPIQVPHSFSGRHDKEISAFLTASIAWGNRASIIRSANLLMDLMDRDPYRFVMTCGEAELSRLDRWVHRTFNGADMRAFAGSLRRIYAETGGLERLFTDGFADGGARRALAGFRKAFVSDGMGTRTRRHISDVESGSAAKRLNLFVMWMVREDPRGVHFGLWKGIPMSDLMIPLDTHVGRVARLLGLLGRRTNDWKAVEELTARLREIDPEDPCRFDFSLFGLGLFDRI